jgi:hypothetical protein
VRENIPRSRRQRKSGQTLRPERRSQVVAPGDALIVWKLDRLGRSLSHLVETVADLGARGINFRSLSDPIDTQSAGGRLVLHIMAALAEFERSIIIERTRAGLAAAERRGRKLGRPRSLSPFDAEAARDLLDMGDAVADVARALGIARSTLYESLARNETKAAAPMRLRRAKPYGPNPECPYHRIDRSFHLLRKTLVLPTVLAQWETVVLRTSSDRLERSGAMPIVHAQALLAGAQFDADTALRRAVCMVRCVWKWLDSCSLNIGVQSDFSRP